MIFGAIGSVIMIIILIAMGFLAAQFGWVSKGTPKFITKIIINITLPCTILYSFLNSFTAEELLSSGGYILAAFAGVLLAYVAGLAAARAARIERRRRGVFTALFSFSNSVFIGFPVAQAIFGESGMIFAIFYFLANTTGFNILGYMQIARDGAYMKSREALAAPGIDAQGGLYGDEQEAVAQGETAWSVLKRVLQPPLFAIGGAIVLVLLGVKLPAFLNSTLSYAGGVTSPLSLMFVGMILHRVGFRTLRFEKGLPLVMIGRFLIAPLIMFGLSFLLLRTDPFASQVFIVQMALPCMVTAVIYAEATGADSGYAMRGMVLSTLLSFIMLPVLVILFGGM
jgi:predicted permease